MKCQVHTNLLHVNTAHLQGYLSINILIVHYTSKKLQYLCLRLNIISKGQNLLQNSVYEHYFRELDKHLFNFIWQFSVAVEWSVYEYYYFLFHITNNPVLYHLNSDIQLWHFFTILVWIIANHINVKQYEGRKTLSQDTLGKSFYDQQLARTNKYTWYESNPTFQWPTAIFR